MTALERVALRAATAYVRLTMSAPVYRDQNAQFEMTVADVADLGGGMRRVTFAADELVGFELAGADEYFGLLMPRPGTELRMPDDDRENVRAAINQLPEEERPDLRWYTIRSHDGVAGRIEVDIVTHGDSGPGSAWAVRAAAGDRVGFRSGSALFRGHECDGPIVVIADETALPAVAAIVDHHADLLHRTTIHVEVADESILTAYDFGAAQTSVHVRGSADPGSVVLPALRASTFGDVDYAWICGESGMVTQARRHFVKSVGVDRRKVLFSGYWKLGQERG